MKYDPVVDECLKLRAENARLKTLNEQMTAAFNEAARVNLELMNENARLRATIPEGTPVCD